MNLKKLESRFKDIEQREKNLNSFFNPFNSKGPKHYCIKDLHKDFEDDTQLYGLGKFYQLPSGTALVSEAQATSQVSFKSPLKVVRSSPGKNQKNSPLQGSRAGEPYKTTSKFEYCGTFSTTTVKPRVTSLSSNANLRNSCEWTASNINDRITNKSALEKIRFEQVETLPINLNKKLEKVKNQIDPKEWVTEHEYKSKPQKRFVIYENEEKPSPEEKKPEKRESRSKWFDIRYISNPLFVAKDKGAITVTLVSGDPKTIKFKTKPNEQFCLSEISWLHSWKKKIIRIQEYFSVFSEYFLYFGEKFEGSEKAIEDQIDFYYSSISPGQVKKSSISPVMPINLKKLQYKSPGRSKSNIKLPLIKEKINDVPEECYHNPITQRLVKYRQSFNQFNPMTFPANLTIFEMHDKMETKYKKYRKEQSPPVVENLELDVKGKAYKSRM